uniref:Uncharacterized protein n=1 Tax=Romanomermis culicivorax TaxID=13658 RepID=A0A915II41_ROMCU
GDLPTFDCKIAANQHVVWNLWDKKLLVKCNGTHSLTTVAENIGKDQCSFTDNALGQEFSIITLSANLDQKNRSEWSFCDNPADTKSQRRWIICQLNDQCVTLNALVKKFGTHQKVKACNIVGPATIVLLAYIDTNKFLKDRMRAQTDLSLLNPRVGRKKQDVVQKLVSNVVFFSTSHISTAANPLCQHDNVCMTKNAILRALDARITDTDNRDCSIPEHGFQYPKFRLNRYSDGDNRVAEWSACSEGHDFVERQRYSNRCDQVVQYIPDQELRQHFGTRSCGFGDLYKYSQRHVICRIPENRGFIFLDDIEDMSQQYHCDSNGYPEHTTIVCKFNDYCIPKRELMRKLREMELAARAPCMARLNRQNWDFIVDYHVVFWFYFRLSIFGYTDGRRLALITWNDDSIKAKGWRTSRRLSDVNTHPHDVEICQINDRCVLKDVARSYLKTVEKHYTLLYLPRYTTCHFKIYTWELSSSTLYYIDQ